MNIEIMPIITTVLVLLGLGFTAAAILAVASKVLYVKEDPRIAKVEDALPGANCGGCGYPGCAAAAAAVVSGEAGASVCVVGGSETAECVAVIMGLSVEYKEPQLAEPDCTGGTRAEDLYRYEGVSDCRAQYLLFGGAKMCDVGCLGLGSCQKACPFDAITMGKHGLPVVNPVLCRACGKCVEACPRGVMSVLGMSDNLTHLNLTNDCLAPCRQICPAQIDIPRYIEHARNGDYAASVLTIKERNPLLISCGRVCPHPCEEYCRRGHVDEPVAINNIKRFVSEWEMNSGTRLPIPIAPETGRKVAVIGGGPAGLSCAYFLRRLGHSPVIFEEKPKLGGQLRYGIPEYRLPKKALDWEIEGILELGIEARTNQKFGFDVNMETLTKEGFEAVMLGIGAWLNTPLPMVGSDLLGVMSGTEFLTSVGLDINTGLGKKVIVVGGGNTAIDAARTSLRLGAQVTLMYRRTEKEMPANALEIQAAKEEGVNMLFLANPTKAMGERGRVTSVEYLTMELGEPDASGRRKPVPIPDSMATIECDTIIAAIGQKPDISCLYERGADECSFDTTKWRTIAAHPDTLQTTIPFVFTAGDAFTGADLVVTAVGGGRKAARSIHYYLNQGKVPVPANLQTKPLPETMFTNVENVCPVPRVPTPELCTQDRVCNFTEVEQTLTEKELKVEACRCLNCGLTCYDRTESKENAQYRSEGVTKPKTAPASS